jgi:hypothetical protein
VDTSAWGGALVVGSSCTISVAFKPVVTGAASGLLTITDNSANSGKTQVVKLSGTGTAPVPVIAPGNRGVSSASAK